MLRSLWDVAPLLQSGALVRILPDFVQQADVWAVYPSKLSTLAKLRVCVDWLEESLQAAILERRTAGDGA